MANIFAYRDDLKELKIDTSPEKCNDVYVSMQFTQFYPTAIATRGGDFWVTNARNPQAPDAIYYKVGEDDYGRQ